MEGLLLPFEHRCIADRELYEIIFLHYIIGPYLQRDYANGSPRLTLYDTCNSIKSLNEATFIPVIVSVYVYTSRNLFIFVKFTLSEGNSLPFLVTDLYINIFIQQQISSEDDCEHIIHLLLIVNQRKVTKLIPEIYIGKIRYTDTCCNMIITHGPLSVRFGPLPPYIIFNTKLNIMKTSALLTKTLEV